MNKIFCHSLTEVDLNYCISYRPFLKQNDVVELRLDSLDFGEEDIKKYYLETKGLTTIASYKYILIEDDSLTDDDLSEATHLLSTAIMCGTTMVDISIDYPPKEKDWLIHLAMNYHCKLIISYHNDYGSQSVSELKTIVEDALALGADYVKIITTARHPAQTKNVLSLYDLFPDKNLIAFAMGTSGSLSRIEAVEKGCPFYYVTPRQSRLSTDGQPTFFDILDRDFKKYVGSASAAGNWNIGAIWVVMGITVGESLIKDLPLDSDQASCAILDVIDKAGGDVGYYVLGDSDDELADFSAQRSVTFGFEFDLQSAPELIGPLILLGLRSEGTTRLLHVDKSQMMYVKAFQKVGANLTMEGEDCLLIKGGFNFYLKGGKTSCYGNKLLAMSLSAARLISSSQIYIEGFRSVERDWPLFKC